MKGVGERKKVLRVVKYFLIYLHAASCANILQIAISQIQVAYNRYHSKKKHLKWIGTLIDIIQLFFIKTLIL